MTDHPKNGELSSWQWDYPVGAGEYRALFPKSWYDYKWDRFPAHVVLEQFSPVLPDNYKESSYPVAVYNWHAENPTKKAVTVSVLLSWTNMGGWFRTYTHDFQGALNQGNQNHFRKELLGDGRTMIGIVFDRNRVPGVGNEWDGEFSIAAIESPGVEVTFQTEFLADGDGKAVWLPFSKDGRLANSDTSWVSASEKIGGAIAIKFTLEPGEKKECADGDFLGLSGRGIWSRSQMEQALYGFLWNRWTEFVGDCPGWIVALQRVERCHNGVASALRERSKQTGLVSRNVV